MPNAAQNIVKIVTSKDSVFHAIYLIIEFIVEMIVNAILITMNKLPNKKIAYSVIIVVEIVLIML